MFDGRLTLSAMGAVAGAQGGSAATTRRLNPDEVAPSLFEPKAAVPAPPLEAAEQRAAAAATRHLRPLSLIHI